MIIRIIETKKSIFEEKLTGFSVPDGFSVDNITFIVYQFHSKTLFSRSVYNKVKSAYFIGNMDREISHKVWTKEMIAHANMREKTIEREPKSIHYTILGKALFTLLFALVLIIGFLAVQSISYMKKEKAEEALLSEAPKNGDVYYGHFNEFAPSGASLRMGWTWLRIMGTEGGAYLVSIHKIVKESPSSDGPPNTGFEERTYKVLMKGGASPSFKSPDNNFDFTAMRKQ